MSQARRFLFVSYSQTDERTVSAFLSVLREELQRAGVPVDLWRDRDSLLPGTAWEKSIREALARAIGMLVFVSQAAMKSEWVKEEIFSVLGGSDRLIVPILLTRVDDLPPQLRARQWIDLSDPAADAASTRDKAIRLVRGIEAYLAATSPRAPLTQDQAPRFASFVADSARQLLSSASAPTEFRPPDSVFVVHGHDGEALETVCGALEEVGVKPVVLSKSLGQSQSLLQKFLSASREARFAVVVMSGDDYGASAVQYEAEGVGDRALQFRARQNVILELGFFYGQLGWENVFVLQSPPRKVFPNFERPSDLDGVVFDTIDPQGRWKATLAAKLQDLGFQLKDGARLGGV